MLRSSIGPIFFRALLLGLSASAQVFPTQVCAADTILKVSRFAGFGPQHEGVTETLFAGPERGTLSGNQSISVSVGDAEKCEKLLSRQEFPLGAMVRDGKLTPAQAEAYAQLAKSLNRDSIHFFEVFRQVAEESGEEGMRPLFIDGKELPGKLHATLWSISGQNGASLPWMLEPGRAELARRLDRGKYRFIWELGRWAQDIPDFSAPAVAAALSTMVQEYLAYLGREQLEDAYVMIHSVSAVHTRYYDRILKFVPYRLEGESDPTDMLYAVPLKILLGIFPPSRHSARIAALKSHFEGYEVSEELLVLIGTWAGQLGWEEIDSPAVVLRDYSGLLPAKLEARLRTIGIPSDRVSAIAREALRHVKSAGSHWDDGSYPDLPPAILTFSKLRDWNAVEISNLDRSAVLADSGEEYLLRLLTRTLVYNLLRVLSGREQVTEELVAPWAQAMVQSGVHFAVSTFDPAVAARLDRLGPELRHEAGGSGSNAQSPQNGLELMLGFLNAFGVQLPGGVRQFQEMSGGRRAYLCAFSARQLFQLMLERRPDLWVLATTSGAMPVEERYTSRALRADVNF